MLHSAGWDALSTRCQHLYAVGKAHRPLQCQRELCIRYDSMYDLALAVTSEQKKRFNVSRCSGPHGHRRRRGAVHGRLHDGGAAADLGCDASAERAAKRRQRGRRRLKAGRPRCRGCQRYKVGIASRAELPRIRVLASLLTALSGRLPADSVARQDFPRTRAVVVRAAMASELFKKQM